MRQRSEFSAHSLPMCRGFLYSLTLAALLAGGLPADAQLGRQRAAMLDGYEEFDLDQLSPRHRRWIEAEVVHLITEEERRVFLRLASERQRDDFIEEFWKQRDPTPGTPRNENRDEWYERFEYVNKIFGRSTSAEGWQTDRGRIFMTLGEPRIVNRYPSDMLTYPAEVWVYSADPDLGLPPFFYMVFYQRYGAGDYRLYSPLSDGPEKLLNGAGTQEVENRRGQDRYNRQGYGFNPEGFYGDSHLVHSILREIDFDLASAAFNLFPSEAGLEFNVSPLRSEVLIGQVGQVKDVIMPDPTWAYNILTGVTESDVRFETLTVDVVAHGLIDADGEPFLHFAAVASGEDLNVSDYDNEYYFTFDANGSVSTVDNTVLQNFDMNLTGELERDQAQRFTRNPFIYLDMLPTLPGPQRLALVMSNEAALTFGQVEVTVDVPQKFPPAPEIAGPVLLAGAQRLPNYDPFGERYAFQYEDVGMIPATDGTALIGPPLQLFEQILLPEGYDQPVVATVELRDPSGAVALSDEVTFQPGDADEHGVLAQIWSLDTQGLVTGDYTIRVTAGGAVKTLAVQLQVPPAELAQPFLNAQPAPPPTDISVALERARQYRAVGDVDQAVVWLRGAIERDPDNDELRAEHVELLESAGMYEELIEVLLPAMIDNPNNVDLLRRLAEAHASAGQHYDAIRYYERLRMVSEEDSPETLNALANEYLADEQPDKARQLFQQSLELNAEQPEVRELLNRIAVPVSESQS